MPTVRVARVPEARVLVVPVLVDRARAAHRGLGARRARTARVPVARAGADARAAVVPVAAAVAVATAEACRFG